MTEAVEFVYQEFIDWCGRLHAAGKWIDPVAIAATRVRLSLQACAVYPERTSFVRALAADVARLQAALVSHSSKAPSH
jgi:hypothetical protein